MAAEARGECRAIGGRCGGSAARVAGAGRLGMPDAGSRPVGEKADDVPGGVNSSLERNCRLLVVSCQLGTDGVFASSRHSPCCGISSSSLGQKFPNFGYEFGRNLHHGEGATTQARFHLGNRFLVGLILVVFGNFIRAFLVPPLGEMRGRRPRHVRWRARRGLTFFFVMNFSVEADDSTPAPVWRANRMPSPQIYHLRRATAHELLSARPAACPTNDDGRIRAAGSTLQHLVQHLQHLGNLDTMVMDVRLAVCIPVKADPHSWLSVVRWTWSVVSCPLQHSSGSWLLAPVSRDVPPLRASVPSCLHPSSLVPKKY